MDKIITEVYKGYTIQIGYDENADNPFECADGNGIFYHWKNHGKEQYYKYCELLGYNTETGDKTKKQHNDAILIDKYEHSGISYSIHGEGHNCKWDTSSCHAVWYPDACILDELKEYKGKSRKEKLLKYAKQACELFNKWANGEVYKITIKKGEDIIEAYGDLYADIKELIEFGKQDIDFMIEKDKQGQKEFNFN